MAFVFVGLGWTSFGLGQAPQPTAVPSPEREKMASAGERLPGQQLSGTNINGTIVDQSGAVIAGARVRLMGGDQSLNQEVLSGADGGFSFVNIPPGPFQLIITSAGFATQTFSGILHSGEVYAVPQITLAVAAASVNVQVGLSQSEVAEQQIKAEEKQRVLGLIPNFYVSYVPNAVPLTSKQKFELAWKTTVDPVTFLVVGGAAGVEQAQNSFSGYGQGAQGYGKRYGAGYADTVTGTFIGGAILPSLLKQDPRYFYKGSGSKRSRILYAIANSVICKGDNRRWQACYSGIIGSLAAGGISNLYYPASNRGAGLVFENTAIGIGESAISNLFQEFLFRKLTPKIPNNTPAKP
jgi:Carboxypeptidase regulatory-like domain